MDLGPIVEVHVDGSVENLELKRHTLVFLAAPVGIENGSIDDSFLTASGAVSGKMTVNGRSNTHLSSCTNVITSGEANCTEHPWGGSLSVIDLSRKPAIQHGVYTCSAAQDTPAQAVVRL